MEASSYQFALAGSSLPTKAKRPSPSPSAMININTMAIVLSGDSHRENLKVFITFVFVGC